MVPPCHYFPVSPGPLRMRAGLLPFGEDLGNGPRDAQLFQRDDAFEAYQAAKARVRPSRLIVVEDTPAQRAVHDAALACVAARLRSEHGVDVDEDPPPGREARWRALTALMQEDLAVLHRGDDDAGDAVMLHVCFPSGWRPERLRGASFAGIHEPVPEFAKARADKGEPVGHTNKAAQSMVRAMVDRGPYVRFVWTVAADDTLDHHPEEGRRAPWVEDVEDATIGWLRVERQVTWPLPDVGGALFAIRTYLTPFATMTNAERGVLDDAIATMPDDIAAYKGLLAGRDEIRRRLAACGLPGVRAG